MGKKKLEKNNRDRQNFKFQLTENLVINKELNLLDSGNNVFKLLGPMLIRQELIEVSSNVSKRIEIICKELERLSKQKNDLEKIKHEKQKDLEKPHQKLIQEHEKSYGYSYDIKHKLR